MLEIFRNNHIFNTLLLILYTLLVRVIPLFFGDTSDIDSEGIWTRWVFGDVITENFINNLLAALLVFLQAAMLNRLIIRNRITNEITLFPGLFYILLVSFFPGMTVLSSALIANTFALIGLGELFSAHKKSKTAELVFSSGFWFSCAALTYDGYFLLLLFPLLGLSTLRTVKWKNVSQYLVGILTPFLITSMISFLVDETFFSSYSKMIESIGVYNLRFEDSSMNIAQVVFFLVWTLAALLQYNGFTIKKNIHAQKKVDLFYWMMGFIFIATFFRSFHNEFNWVLLSLPLSAMVAMTFIGIRTKIVAEMLHFFLLLGLLAIQIIHFF